MPSIKDYEAIQERIEDLKSSLIECRVEQKRYHENLKKMGYDTVEDAESEIQSLNSRIEKLHKQIQIRKKKWTKKWGKVITPK